MSLSERFWITEGLSLTEFKQYSPVTLIYQVCRLILILNFKVLHPTVSSPILLTEGIRESKGSPKGCSSETLRLVLWT